MNDNLQVAVSITPKKASTPKHYITILFGTWLIFGVFIDGYAHNHGVVETFFTPWHAILYSGFLTSAAWMVWLLYRSRQTTGLPWLQAAPEGYGLGLIGAGIFLLGGIADMIWHIVFGIEQNTAALLSPSHLVLLIGGVLILSSPFRAGWSNRDMKEPGWREFAAPFLSLAITMGVVCFFLMYAWMFRSHLATGYLIDWYWKNFHSGVIQEDNETRGLSYILLDTVLFMLPVFLMMKRWKLPPGTIAFLFTIITVLMNVLDGFSQYRTIFVALAAGLIGDILYKYLRPSETRLWVYRIIAFIVPAAMWTIYFIWMRFLDSIGWSVELWTGSIVEAGLASLGLSLLALSRRPG